MSSGPRCWDSNTQVRSAGENGVMQPQTDEQRGKRACALTARGSISKAMKGLVGGAAQGSADCRKNWSNSPHSHEARAMALIPPLQKVPRRRRLLGVVEGTKRQRSAMTGARPQHYRYRVAPARQTAHECFGANRLNGRNIRRPSSPSQEPVRGGACFGDSTFSQWKWVFDRTRLAGIVPISPQHVVDGSARN